MKKHLISQSVIALLPLIYLSTIWSTLPVLVPLHYDASGAADRMGSPVELFFVLGMMTVIGIGVSALLLNIEKIDPKNKLAGNSSLMIKISWATCIFITVIGLFIVIETANYKGGTASISGKAILVLIAIFFSVLGNFMNNVKPNYFVGVRTPWTLESPEVWRKTHHLTSKLWFFGGIVIAGIVLILPEELGTYVFLGLIMIMSLWPVLYSYLIFKSSKKEINL